MEIKRLFAFLPIGLFMIIACNDNRVQGDVLASAFGNKLYVDDLSEMLIDVNTKSDSNRIISKHIDNWLMDEILVEESKQRKVKQAELKELADQYFRAISIHALEEQVLSEMDTSVSKQELDTIASSYQKELTLQEDIVKFLYIKVPESFNNDTLKILWKTEDISGLKSFVLFCEGFSLLDLDHWYFRSELKSVIPSELYNKINFSKSDSYSLIQDGHKFYIKILEKIDSKDEVPLSFAREKLKHRILKDRSRKYINDWKINLYQSKIKSKEISIYDRQ